MRQSKRLSYAKENCFFYLYASLSFQSTPEICILFYRNLYITIFDTFVRIDFTLLSSVLILLPHSVSFSFSIPIKYTVATCVLYIIMQFGEDICINH